MDKSRYTPKSQRASTGLLIWQLGFGFVGLLAALILASVAVFHSGFPLIGTVVFLVLGLQNLLSAIYMKHRNDYLNLDERISAIEDALRCQSVSPTIPPLKEDDP
jgi:hypothetical protein